MNFREARFVSQIHLEMERFILIFPVKLPSNSSNHAFKCHESGQRVKLCSNMILIGFGTADLYLLVKLFEAILLCD